MRVEQLEIPKEKAIEEYDAYKQVLKKPQFEHQQYLKDLKAIYGHMKHGRSIIDLWASMKKAGLNKEGDPLLAIIQANSTKVRFIKNNDGRGVFLRFHKDGRKWSGGDWSEDIKLPPNTLPTWPTKTELVGAIGSQWKRTDIINKRLETIVPIIPAKFLTALRGSLKNYHILWEVKEWKRVPPRDPILLRKLTPNMFVVLATWNLTKLERAVIRGRIT